TCLAIASVPPPAAHGTTIVISFSGKLASAELSLLQPDKIIVNKAKNPNVKILHCLLIINSPLQNPFQENDYISLFKICCRLSPLLKYSSELTATYKLQHFLVATHFQHFTLLQ